jgi:hypothetical protein
MDAATSIFVAKFECDFMFLYSVTAAKERPFSPKSAGRCQAGFNPTPPSRGSN